MRFINSDKNVVRRVVAVDYFLGGKKKALLAKARKMICFLRLRNFFSLLGKWENLFKLLWKLNDGTQPRNISISSWTLLLLLTFAALPLSKK